MRGLRRGPEQQTGEEGACLLERGMRTIAMSELARTPDMIAGEINTIKSQVRNTALIASVEIGRKLKEAKGMVPEGQWTEWLQASVDYSLRTAQNLMALAAEYDAGHGKALEGMSYTKAVLMLGVPRWEREEFISRNDVEAMSTRELKETIADLQDRLAGRQMDMEEMISEQEAEEARQLKEENEDLKARIVDMQKESMDRNKSAEGFAKEIKLLKDKLTDARTDGVAAEKKAQETIKRLEGELEETKAALAEAKTPMIQQVTPPEVEKELKRLREMASRSAEEQAVRGGYELLRDAYETLKDKLALLEQTDGEKARMYRGAFGKGLRLMADEIERTIDG